MQEAGKCNSRLNLNDCTVKVAIYLVFVVVVVVAGVVLHYIPGEHDVALQIKYPC